MLLAEVGRDVLLAVAGVAVGAIVSTSFGWFFYRRALRDPGPTYVLTGHVVVSGSLGREEIEIRFAGEVVPVVSRTLVVFWNRGRKSIRRDEVPAAHPLRIEVLDDGARVLDAAVITSTRPEIGVEARPDLYGPGVTLSFEFLDYRDGFVVEMLHTSSRPEP